MPRASVSSEVVHGNTILSRTADYGAVTVTIDASKVTPVSGKKIVPAGTFLGGVGGSIMREGAKAQPLNGEETEGLAFNEVDVTDGDMEVAMLYRGTVGLDRIPAAPNEDVNLPRVTFTKD